MILALHSDKVERLRASSIWLHIQPRIMGGLRESVEQCVSESPTGRSETLQGSSKTAANACSLTSVMKGPVTAATHTLHGRTIPVARVNLANILQRSGARSPLPSRAHTERDGVGDAPCRVQRAQFWDILFELVEQKAVKSPSLRATRRATSGEAFVTLASLDGGEELRERPTACVGSSSVGTPGLSPHRP